MMTSLLLQLWRERWGKADDGLPDKPYVKGKPFDWAVKIPQASFWAAPGLWFITALLCISFIALVVTLEFSVNAQISFSGLMVGVTLLLRRYAGSLYTLMLVYLSLLCSMQYFSWRFRHLPLDRFDWSFAWGLGFAVLELGIFFYFFIGWLARLWPVETSQVFRTTDVADLPPVDVLLLVSGNSDDRLIACMKACRTLVWPDKKLNLIVIGTSDDATLVEAAYQHNASYQRQVAHASGNMAGKIAAVHLGMSLTSSAVVLVIDARDNDLSAVDKGLLNNTTGWFETDAGLELIYSPEHFLAPPELAIGHGAQSAAHCAMIRRSAWRGEFTDRSSQTLSVLWQRSALLITKTVAKGQEVVRIDRADSSLIQALKRRLVNLRAVMRFYLPMVQLAFFLTPVIHFFGRVQLVESSADANLESLFVLGVPHLLLIVSLHARTWNLNRLSSIRELRELLLSGYFYFATAWSFVKTASSNIGLLLKRLAFENKDFSITAEVIVAGLCLLNFSAFGFGLLSLFASSEITETQKWRLIYCLWALLNVAMLISYLAVQHETWQVRRFSQQKRHLHGMLRLPYGRTIVCETLNFPSMNLDISTPVPLDVRPNSELVMSIFHNNQSFALTVQVKTSAGLTTHLLVPEHHASQFEVLRQAVFTRGIDWPNWLPKKNADAPLPLWLTNVVSSIPVKLIEYSTQLVMVLKWEFLVQLWRKASQSK
jgi:cellulose synthase (UDP-forming)